MSTARAIAAFDDERQGAPGLAYDAAGVEVGITPTTHARHGYRHRLAVLQSAGAGAEQEQIGAAVAVTVEPDQ
jgi:hypothetical protein